MTQPRDPARTPSAPNQTKKTTDPARRPRPPQGPVAAREWDVAHAAALRALLTQPPAVLPNQVGDPLLPLQIGIWDALLALLRPGAEPEALARALRAYTRSTGYFMACARKGAMRHDLDGRAVEPVSEEHRTGAVKAVQGRRTRSKFSLYKPILGAARIIPHSLAGRLLAPLTQIHGALFALSEVGVAGRRRTEAPQLGSNTWCRWRNRTEQPRAASHPCPSIMATWFRTP